ncbi:MAG TPA: VWA domain-containing protein [Polyangiaceae bacterium]|nr:VWA domain-containing protein [Polyangiaceae bacterium]
MANELAAFHFLRPELLWALVPFALYGLTLVLRGQTASPWAKVVAPHLLRHLSDGSRLQRAGGPEALLALLGTVAVLAAAGPTDRPQLDSGDPSKSPLVIVMDLSRSMGAKDVSPSRAERARLELRDLIRARAESPTALIVVAGSAHVLMPLTDDPSVLDPTLNALAPDLMPSDGKAYPQAAKLIATLAHETASPLSALIVTDGIPPPGVEAFEALHRDHRVGFIVLGTGGAGDPARGIAAADDSGLERFVGSVDGELVELSFAERDVTRILRAIALGRAQGLDRRDARFWEDSGYWLVLPLALGVAYWFRRGFALAQHLAALALFSLSGCSGRAADVWVTPDQQGQWLFDHGRYAEAAERFQDPTWKGLAFYAGGKFDAAAAAFAAVDTKQGLYDLGNAYAQGGKLAAALHAYERALALAPTFREARHNADLMRELIAAQQEDTDQEDFKKDANAAPNDEKTKVSSDQLTGMQPPPPKREAGSEADALALSPAEQSAWLRHVATDPKEFLKRKLALLAAREDTP